MHFDIWVVLHFIYVVCRDLGSFAAALTAIIGPYIIFKKTSEDENIKRLNKLLALRIEIRTFVKYLIASLENCIAIGNGSLAVPRKDAIKVTNNIPKTIIYNNVYDVLGSWSKATFAVEYYARINETKALSDTISFAYRNNENNDYLDGEIVAPIAKCLITALEIALSILKDNSQPKEESKISMGATSVAIRDIEDALNKYPKIFDPKDSNSDNAHLIAKR